jgi:hypothetical protein
MIKKEAYKTIEGYDNTISDDVVIEVEPNRYVS